MNVWFQKQHYLILNVKIIGFIRKVLSSSFIWGTIACSPAKNGKVAIRNVEGCWVMLALFRKTAVGK